MNRFMRPSAPYTYPHRGSLDVTKFGVQELNAKEMVEVEGGLRVGPESLVEKIYKFIANLF